MGYRRGMGRGESEGQFVIVVLNDVLLIEIKDK